MFALYKLQLKVSIKNPFLIFDFLISFLFILIFGSIINASADLNDQEKVILMTEFFGFILAILLISSGIYSFGFSFFTMKESILLKRIGASKITKTEAISAFMLSGFTILIFAIIWAFFVVWIFSDDVFKVIPSILWTQIKWGAVIYGVAVGAIASYIIGFFFVSISPNSEIYNVFTTFYYFIALFLSGGFNFSGETIKWMEVIGWLTPLGWNSKFISDAMIGLDVWNLSGYSAQLGTKIIETEAWEATLDVFMPLIFAGLAGLASLKTFKWDS